MSQKIEISGNYLVITNTEDSTTIEYPSSRVRYKDTPNVITFDYIDDDSQNIEVAKADIVDSSGSAFSSDEELLTWLRDNTGQELNSDYNTKVAEGKIEGASLWNKFGYNDDIDVGTEVIASWGGTFTPLTTAGTLLIASSSSNDTDGGTGCNSIVIYGIDSNRDEQIEVVLMNGTTTVNTTTTWLGINRVAMFLCGSGQINAGDIAILSSVGGATMAVMPLGGGVTQQCIFHVPANNNFVMEWLMINVLNQGKNAELNIKMWVYSAVSNGKQEVFRVNIDTAVTNEPIELNPNLPFPVSEKTVVWIECTSDKANVIVNARFSGILDRIS